MRTSRIPPELSRSTVPARRPVFFIPENASPMFVCDVRLRLRKWNLDVPLVPVRGIDRAVSGSIPALDTVVVVKEGSD